MKITIKYLSIGMMAIVFSIIVLFGIQFSTPKVDAQSNYRYPTLMTASTTSFSISTSAVRILGTSTQPRRVAATIQPINCFNGGGGVFMQYNDVNAVINTGTFATASSTTLLGDYINNIPVVQGSVKGVVGSSSGTCTVLVTEWRSQY